MVKTYISSNILDYQCNGFPFICRAKELKESPKSREQIAAEMSEAMDCPSFSKAMLDNYSSEANELHQIPLYRFIVLVRVADAAWAWDELLKDEGFTVLFGDEALLAERGRVAQQIEELKKISKRIELGCAY